MKSGRLFSFYLLSEYLTKWLIPMFMSLDVSIDYQPLNRIFS